jgi:hypothetical protein
MAKIKRRRPRKSAARKSAQRRATASKSLARKRRSNVAARITAKRKRARSPTVKAAAKRVLVSAGRTAGALARAGAVHAARTGRRVIARGVRSVAKEVQQAAQGAGDVTASAFESIADRVEPPRGS